MTKGRNRKRRIAAIKKEIALINENVVLMSRVKADMMKRLAEFRRSARIYQGIIDAELKHIATQYKELEDLGE